MKPKRKERHRSTNLELLGGVGTDALRRMREIATKADLPLSRVFRDVIAIGVRVVTGEESPYQSLIDFRNGLANREVDNVETQSRVGEAQTGAELGAGDRFSEPVSLYDRLEGSSRPPSIDSRSGDAVIERGFEPQSEENSGLPGAGL